MENKQHDSFVIYRLPSENTCYLIEGSCNPEPKQIEELKGNNFVISPFNSGQKAFYIPYSEARIFSIQERFPIHFGHNGEASLPKEHYTNLVSEAKEQMKKGTFHKVVLANTKRINTNSFDPISFFKKIEKEYPNAFVYVLSTPYTGVWIGASPEILLIGKNSNFKTIALAGTKLIDSISDFGVKEIEEQHLVEQFIENELNQKKIRFSKTGPLPYNSGALTHLKSEYSFTLLQNEAFKLLSNLNPTPAIAGLPKIESLKFIKEKEGFERSLYAGFLGPLSPDSLSLFVNLRCLTWYNGFLKLYAGAGITIDSNEEKEWIETQNKMKTLEKFI
ncbi:MAG: chorismate-binding protein [bacterium]|nr:chorismate-binding protein [bacterium]